MFSIISCLGYKNIYSNVNLWNKLCNFTVYIKIVLKQIQNYIDKVNMLRRVVVFTMVIQEYSKQPPGLIDPRRAIRVEALYE